MFPLLRVMNRLVELMSLVETAIGNLTTAIDTLVANGGGVSTTDAADAALIDAQTARVVAATAPGTAPGPVVTVPGTFPVPGTPTAPGNPTGAGVIS